MLSAGLQRLLVASGRRGMCSLAPGVTALRMPALSPTMTHGKLVEWTIEEGGSVDEGSVLAEVETDKATVALEQQDEGFLAKIIVPAGTEDVPVGTVIALLVEEEEDIPKALEAARSAPPALDPPAQADTNVAAPAAAETPAPVTTPSAAASPASAEINDPTRFMPSARHLMATHGVAMSSLPPTGSGHRGRYTKGDVLAAMGRISPPSATQAAGMDTSASAAAAPVPAMASAGVGSVVGSVAASVISSMPVPPAVPAFEEGARAEDPRGETVEPASTMRRVIASRLTESKCGTPHFTALMDIPLDKLMGVRGGLKAAGVKTSVNDFIVKGCAMALRDVPEMNCSYVDGRIVQNSSVDVSVAVATPGGLITPIVRDASGLGVGGIGAAVKDLAVRARGGKLAPDEYQGGSFTISNLGMFGIDEFTAVINPPQAAILAVGQGVTRVVPPEHYTPAAPASSPCMKGGSSEIVDLDAYGDSVHGGEGEGGGGASAPAPAAAPVYATETVMSVQLSADRRVVDEHVAAQFLAALKGYLEDPTRLMV